MIPAIVTPINPATGAPVVGITSGALSGNAPQVPPAISALAPGTIIKGFVLTRDGTGNPTLRSGLGDFLIQSNFFLRIGSDVTVRVEAWGKHFRANIIEVDGKPVTADPHEPTTSQPAQKNTSDQIIRSQWIPELSPKNVDGKNELQAVLLNPSGTAAQSQGLKEGTALLVKLFNIQLPNPPAPMTQASAPTTTSAPAQQTTTTQVAGNAPLPTANTMPGTSPLPATLPIAPQVPQQQISQAYQASNQLGKVDATMPNSELLPDIPPAGTAPREAMFLTVIGQERDGEAVLQSPFGLVKITSNVTLPTGTQLFATLSLLPGQAAENPLPIETTGQPVSLTQLAQKWTSLTQILQILTEQNEGVLPANIAAALPTMLTTPNSVNIRADQAGAGLFLFMAALGGDFRSFLGDRNVKLLEKLGHTGLLNKADTEFGMLARFAADHPQQGWNSMFLPLLVNNQVEMVRWFTKREQEKDKDGRKTSDGLTRFIVEVSLSQLGDMQLDGFYKADMERKSFDLTVRTHQPLDPEIQKNIMDIFTEAQVETGVVGAIVFQSAVRFPVSPLQEILQNPPDVIA